METEKWKQFLEKTKYVDYCYYKFYYLDMANVMLSSNLDKTTMKYIWDTLIKFYKVKSLYIRISVRLVKIN